MHLNGLRLMKLDHFQQSVRIVGNDGIHSGINHPNHFLVVIHRPGYNLHPSSVGFVYTRFGDKDTCRTEPFRYKTDIAQDGIEIHFLVFQPMDFSSTYQIGKLKFRILVIHVGQGSFIKSLDNQTIA